jgi:hypothetical protein
VADTPNPPETPDDEPSHDDEAAPAEIVAHEPGGEIAGDDRGALLHWLEQSHRDAKASRAQARELVRALEQVRDAHEYVGRALRDEQQRNRRLTVALILAPALAALAIWGVWDRLDHMRGDVTDQIRNVADAQDRLRATQEQMRFGEAAEAQRSRADALEAELERARTDLSVERKAAAERAEERLGQEATLRAQIERLEDENAETDGLRAQLQALRSRSGAESARAQELEREIRRLERELGAAQAGDSVARTTRPLTPGALPPMDMGTPEPAVATPADDDPGNAALGEAAEPAAGDDPLAGAVRRPEDLDRIRQELNRLLALAGDAVTYQVDGIGGVRGDTLMELRLSGVDANGRTIRTLEAQTATVVVREESDDVLVDLRDGHLLLAGRKAPFFDGRYAIVVASEPEAWRISGLTCITFE